MGYNANVETLQRRLSIHPVDGLWGPVTERAVIAAAKAGRLVVAAAPSKPAQPISNIPDVAGGAAIPEAAEIKLRGVHQDLADVIREAARRSDVPFTVTEGLRTADRQRDLVARGASKTVNSRHLTGHAVDLWPLDPETGRALPSGTKAAEARLWADLRAIAAVVKTVATERRVIVEWGGDWGWDAPHFQLNRLTHPA